MFLNALERDLELDLPNIYLALTKCVPGVQRVTFVCVFLFKPHNKLES